MASSSESLIKINFICPFFCRDRVDSTSMAVSELTLFSVLHSPVFSGSISCVPSLCNLSTLSSHSCHSLSSLSSLSHLLFSISPALFPYSNGGWVSVGTSIFLLLPLGMVSNYMYNSSLLKSKNLNYVKSQNQKCNQQGLNITNINLESVARIAKGRRNIKQVSLTLRDKQGNYN